MSWNYRIMAELQPNGDPYFEIHEVFYDENGVAHSHTANAVTVGAKDALGIAWTLEKMLEATSKPIIWKGEKFPNEFKEVSK